VLAGRFFDSSCCWLLSSRLSVYWLLSSPLSIYCQRSWQLIDALLTSLAISCSLHAPLFYCWLLSCLCYFTVHVDLFTFVSLLAALFAHVSLLAALLVLHALLSKTQEFDETFPSAGVAGFTVM
jgi:hypothetical protein